MKPHPRIRKTIKWGGAVVTVLLVVAWIGSGWGEIEWESNSGQWIGLGAGRLLIGGTLGLASSPFGPGWKSSAIHFTLFPQLNVYV